MDKISLKDNLKRTYLGEVELAYIDPKTNEVVEIIQQHNLVKIFAKEILSHRAPGSLKWDPLGGASGTDGGDRGAWVESGVDVDEDFALKYILFGASFDPAGRPLDVNDDRYYQQDTVTGLYRPIRLEPGAYYEGGLINPVPINEDCRRPLKRIENFWFEPTYQPAGTPLLQEDVRAINNVLVCETTLRPDEYNGFFGTEGDCFTITEVALAAGRRIDEVSECDATPRDIFLEGPFEAQAMPGTNVVQLTSDCTSSHGDDWCPYIREGDQIKITGTDGTDSPGADIDQISPFYLVVSKDCFGQNLILDRVPTTSDGGDISGNIYVWRDTLRMFSHRILNSPAKKTEDFAIRIRWRIIFS